MRLSRHERRRGAQLSAPSGVRFHSRRAACCVVQPSHHEESVTDETLSTGIAALERQLHVQRRLFLGAIALFAGVALACFVPKQNDVIRAHGLVIVDSLGRERIVLGAPMPDGRAYVGMKLLNATGAEQFGLGIKPDGGVSMGFDIKPGVGNPANPERLNLGVTPTGQGWIRFLDNQTRARLFVLLDSSDAPLVRFLEWPDTTRIVERQIGARGEQTVERKR